jgi:adenine deaminase
MNFNKLIRSSRGDEPADVVFSNARIINVFTGGIISGNVGVKDGYILGVGDYEGRKTVNLKNKLMAPGFMDAHVHIESSMTGISEYVRTVAATGTTAVVADPHEIANVMGIDGIRYMFQSAEHQPMDIYFAVPSCVPATSMETSGAIISSMDLPLAFEDSRVVALGEMMNYPGVIYEDREVLEKMDVARKYVRVLDGHCPGVSGKKLNAYIAAGIGSDHECVSAAEAMEKLSAGMVVMVREGSGAKNLKDLLPAINSRTSCRMMWCTDDRNPHDLTGKGHIDALIREAVCLGLDPITAIQMATINPACYFGIRDIGAVSPGKKANLVIFEDINRPVVEEVYFKGVKIAENGELSSEIQLPGLPDTPSTLNVDGASLDFGIRAESNHIHLIEMVENQIVTRHQIARIPIIDQMATVDLSRDILKCAVIERHRNTGNIGKGFVKGFGFKHGALASSVAHDSHNIIVIGANDEDMKVAVLKVIEMEGGIAVAAGKEVRACLALPIAGLMSKEPMKKVCLHLDDLLRVARDMGCTMDDPFMSLSFVALPVIPELKITDLGLVDVARFENIPLFVH